MLLLFDVDGTLLLSSRQGAKAMQEAGKRVVGEHFTLEEVEFAGRLDPLIWADGARLSGADGDPELHDRFRRAYGEALARRLARPGLAYALPGVEDLLSGVADRPGTTLGLLTGNYPETGAIKLRAAGIDPSLFEVPVWGVDGPTRRHLPRVGMERYEALRGQAVDPRRVVIVGDTVHDVDCAHANDCVALAVATGPSYTSDDLSACSPELLVEHLKDTEGILTFLDRVERGEVGTRDDTSSPA